MDDRTRYTLEKIAKALEKNTKALERIATAAEERNKLLEDSKTTTNDAPARLVLGFDNRMEVLTL